jgi:hypothetical protein
MMSVLMLDDTRFSRWCVFDEIVGDEPAVPLSTGLLGFVKKLGGGPRRPKGALPSLHPWLTAANQG